MYTQAGIRRHIYRMSKQVIFTTREFLIYGKRSAVDQALFRMVNDGFLHRLARGVFTRPHHLKKNITIYEVAEAKARAFGKRIATWAGDIAQELGLLGGTTKSENIFSTDGSSSSFRYNNKKIHLRKTCPRKMRLSNTNGGKALKACIYMRPQGLTEEHLRLAMSKCKRTDREEIRLSFAWLPDWLNCRFMHMHLPKDTYYKYPHPYAELPPN